MSRVAGVLAWTVLTGCAMAQFSSVVDSPHNLSTSGPGSIRATSEEQVCIFCHAPHNSTPIRPLWNRAMPLDAYTVYTSRALDAEPGQPTGSSKMCLSCHDGTIALGAVNSRLMPINMMGGVTTMPPGSGLIGTDLSDDHPISFRFDAGLAATDPKLRHPSQLPPEIRLDANSEMQCTSCHDAHNNARGKFLVLSNAGSQLCTSCHQVGTTTITEHQDCNACHQPHSAPSGPYLLRSATVAATCLNCHDGTHGASDIASVMNRLSVHDTFEGVDPPDPYQEHTTCSDCHDPHTMTHGTGTAPVIHPNFGQVRGVSSSGVLLASANYEFEVCFRCHAEGSAVEAYLPRRIAQNNTRHEFSPTAVSFHPVTAPGRNPDVPSLKPTWSESSVMYCSDCHGTDNGGASLGLDGVHGSNIRPLLVANYDTTDYTTESGHAYALCYQCHQRSSILDNESFSGHRLHVVDQRTPCSACHDAHGISSLQGNTTNNSHLINFRTDIVFPDPGTGRLEFRDDGINAGTCFLNCHDHTHSGTSYPPQP